MKCDELKSLKNLEVAFNTTTEQEQVIAEDSEGNCYGFDSWEEVYLKDEVDAAIAELKQKLEDAKATAYAESVDAGMENIRLKRELRHHKFKRGLAMAMWCKSKSEIYNEFAADAAEYMPSYEARFRRKAVHYEKWHKRWLKIAEQFKEAK